MTSDTMGFKRCYCRKDHIMRVDLLTREYPPHVYGGACVDWSMTCGCRRSTARVNPERMAPSRE